MAAVIPTTPASTSTTSNTPAWLIAVHSAKLDPVKTEEQKKKEKRLIRRKEQRKRRKARKLQAKLENNPMAMLEKRKQRNIRRKEARLEKKRMEIENQIGEEKANVQKPADGTVGRQ
ncbi:hypothetical protein OS493_040211 [Desmophyllum pertusum]|uniref:Uncharacterized protein n=1 Tax=Desmophyllum pertusum TaxID=174260 RepID=A0A9W9Y6U3_9CNID|nr:hypothetical protein OS493_040211 [Desmophyllum pertusum]